MKTIIAAIVAAVPLLCQPVSFGVKGGILLDNSPETDNRERIERHRWTVGPTIEFRLPARFSVGFDALYRSIDHSFERSVGSAFFSQQSETKHWEFPLYLKYRFLNGPIQPFVTGGGTADYARTHGQTGCTGDPLLCGTAAGSFPINSTQWGAGFLFGGGVEWKIGRLTLAPELRWNKWVRGYLSGVGPHETSLLLGIRF